MARALAGVALGATALGCGVARPAAGEPEAVPGPAALLRAGVEALAAGRASDAVGRFAAAAERSPLVADHAERLRIAALLAAGDAEAAASAAQAFPSRFPASPLAPRVARLEGDALAALARGAEARAAWSRALDGLADAEARAELHVARARSFEADGRAAEAAPDLLRAWRDLPATVAAADAAAALSRLEGEGRPALRGARDWAERALALAAARRNEEALDAAERALAAGLPPDVRSRLALERAHLLFRLRRYPEAVAAFGALAEAEEEARLYHARSLARSGRTREAIDAFEALGARGGARGFQARFLAATLLEDEGAEGRARAAGHYEAVAGRAPEAGLRQAARWRLGWTAWRAVRRDEAARHFERLARDVADPLERLQPRYWRARAIEARDPDAARAALAEVAAAYPFTYYGWRARQHLGGAAPPATGARPPDAAAGPSSLEPSRLERVGILLEATLLEEASEETERLAHAQLGLGDRLALAALFTRAGEYHRAQTLVVDAALERLAGPPDPARPALWEVAWPRAFASEVDAIAGAPGGPPPALLWAVMREESGYRPDALSISGARGLVQVMPATGASVARKLGWSGFHADQLFEPLRNLALGGSYLAGLLRDFDGRVSAAVAAYNAGPEAVARWIAADGSLADDEWVESIPYDQTRAYVRRVLRSLHVYEALY